jgi:hypothetical protein
VDPRFTDNSDGTVTDNLTGLIWLKNAGCFEGQRWACALSTAHSLADGSCGLTDGSMEGDWRMANVRELLSLIDYGNEAPALPGGHPFMLPVHIAEALPFWSSSSASGFIGQPLTSPTWMVDIGLGLVAKHAPLKHPDPCAPLEPLEGLYLWPVRGGE